MILAAGTTPSPIAVYIAAFTTVGLPTLAFFVRRLVKQLDSLTDQQGTQSSALAVLVERVSPIDHTIAAHDQRLRTVENGQARLEGAMESLRAQVNTATLNHPPVAGSG